MPLWHAFRPRVMIDQYHVSTAKRSGITNARNRHHDPKYIVRLRGQVITVSLATVEIAKSLPPIAHCPGYQCGKRTTCSGSAEPTRTDLTPGRLSGPRHS